MFLYLAEKYLFLVIENLSIVIFSEATKQFRIILVYSCIFLGVDGMTLSIVEFSILLVYKYSNFYLVRNLTRKYKYGFVNKDGMNIIRSTSLIF